METLLKDVRYGIRSLLKQRGFTAIAVLTLAIGIGANTAIFSVVNAVLLRPLPFHNSDELVTLWERNPKQGYEQNPPAAGNYVDWREQNRVFAQLAIYAPWRNLISAWEINRSVSPGRLCQLLCSSCLVYALCWDASFHLKKNSPAKDQVALISHNLWQRHFAGDPNRWDGPSLSTARPTQSLE